MCYPLISDMIFLYQLAQAHPHNVLHFLVVVIGTSPVSDVNDTISIVQQASY